MLFLGALKSSSPRSHAYYIYRTEMAFIKSKSVLKFWNRWLSDGLVEKKVLGQKDGALCDFSQKV